MHQLAEVVGEAELLLETLDWLVEWGVLHVCRVSPERIHPMRGTSYASREAELMVFSAKSQTEVLPRRSTRPQIRSRGLVSELYVVE